MSDSEKTKVKEGRFMQGKVIATKSDKTVTVSVERVFQHPIYKKIIKWKKKYQVHDEYNKCKPGDTVSLKLVRPISKSKRWMVVKILSSDKNVEVTHDSDAN